MKASPENSSKNTYTYAPSGKSRVRDDTYFVDNRPKAAFAYSQSTDTLTYRSTKLKAGRRHTVRIVANDGVLGASRTWSFKVIQRR